MSINAFKPLTKLARTPSTPRLFRMAPPCLRKQRSMLAAA